VLPLHHVPPKHCVPVLVDVPGPQYAPGGHGTNALAPAKQ
jgi:hypothetical protein